MHTSLTLDAAIPEFVAKFAAAWATKDPAAFTALWHPDGKLYYPFTDRVIAGSEIGALHALQISQAPDLAWKLLHWTARGQVVVIEWECSNRYGASTSSWRGVDRITLEDGRIREEIVYSDTAPLRAARAGRALEPLLVLPASSAR